jgi:predicted AAA+ superfamily ATPase
MLARPHEIRQLTRLLARYPVVAILGARQVGKTTLARQFLTGVKGPVTFFDLEVRALLRCFRSRRPPLSGCA